MFNCTGDVSGGAFASLPREAQDLALAFLYYFTINNFSSPLLESIVSCCLREYHIPFINTYAFDSNF